MCSSAYKISTDGQKKPHAGQYLLNHSTTVHLSRQSEHVSLHLIRQDLLLRLVSMFKQLLDDIVAKYIGHQLQAIGLNLAKHLLLLVAVGRFQFLLNETRAVLVATKFNNMVVYVLQCVSHMQANAKCHHTFNSYRLLPLLLARNSSNRGLRTI
jgi:hypothetical protein